MPMWMDRFMGRTEMFSYPHSASSLSRLSIKLRNPRHADIFPMKRFKLKFILGFTDIMRRTYKANLTITAVNN